MQRHDDTRNVTSICHCLRSLPGTGIVIHSRDGPAHDAPTLQSRVASATVIDASSRGTASTSATRPHRTSRRAPRRSARRARSDRCERRAARARAVRARRRGERRAARSRCAGPDRPTRSRRRCASPAGTAARSSRAAAAPASPGGATPLDDPVVIVTTQMNRVLDVDPRARVAWVEPGVLNLDLTRAVSHLGLHYAPDPSSQQACTIGGNVAHQRRRPALPRRRASRPRTCSRSTSCSPTARSPGSAASNPTQPGYDLRGCFVGSEGTMGIATRDRGAPHARPARGRDDAVRLRLDRRRGRDRQRASIAAGVLPGRARDDGRAHHAPRSRTSSARATRATRRRCCSSRSTGSTAASPRRSTRSRAIAGEHGAVSVRVAADDAERALLWKGRKSAFGAIARIAPDYYLHDAVVPRTRLVEVLRARLRDRRRARAHHDERVPRGRRQPASADRVRPARAGRVGARARRGQRDPRRRASTAGGVLTGEHGVGVEKRDLMPLHVLGRRPRRAGAAARRVRSRRRRRTRGRSCRAGAAAASCSACRRARGSDAHGAVDAIAAAVAAADAVRPSARARSGRSGTRPVRATEVARARGRRRGTSPTT